MARIPTSIACVVFEQGGSGVALVERGRAEAAGSHLSCGGKRARWRKGGSERKVAFSILVKKVLCATSEGMIES